MKPQNRLQSRPDWTELNASPEHGTTNPNHHHSGTQYSWALSVVTGTLPGPGMVYLFQEFDHVGSPAG